MWIFLSLSKFDKEQPIMYPVKFTDQQWKETSEPFPEKILLPKVTCSSQEELTK